MVLFRQNPPQPTQAQLMRGEFPEALCIEQGVVLSCRFAEWKVRRAPRVLWMAVVSQSSVKFGKKRVFLVGTINFMTITAEVATSMFVFSPVFSILQHITLLCSMMKLLVFNTVCCYCFLQQQHCIKYKHLSSWNTIHT